MGINIATAFLVIVSGGAVRSSELSLDIEEAAANRVIVSGGAVRSSESSLDSEEAAANRTSNLCCYHLYDCEEDTSCTENWVREFYHYASVSRRVKYRWFCRSRFGHDWRGQNSNGGDCSSQDVNRKHLTGMILSPMSSGGIACSKGYGYGMEMYGWFKQTDMSWKGMHGPYFELDQTTGLKNYDGYKGCHSTVSLAKEGNDEPPKKTYPHAYTLYHEWQFNQYPSAGRQYNRGGIDEFQERLGLKMRVVEAGTFNYFTHYIDFKCRQPMYVCFVERGAQEGIWYAMSEVYSSKSKCAKKEDWTEVSYRSPREGIIETAFIWPVDSAEEVAELHNAGCATLFEANDLKPH